MESRRAAPAGDRGAEVPPPGFGSALGRALRRRCPRCGGANAFVSFFHLRERCPSCDFRFEREEGYWTGAMIVNIAACELWLAILFGIVLLFTFPDVPWGLLLGVGLVTNGLLPVIFYPWSKTIWMAFELYYHWDPTDDSSP
ncbi:MAG: DUF983 domain-containing protein [Actinobacteria bacterium]|nr:DUF983 domain-containing protein [Actinomycetota bacterium]